MEVLHVKSGVSDELEGEMETGPALVDSVDLCKEVIEGRRVVEFIVKWNDGQVKEEILDGLSADSSSSLSEVLNTSAAHTAVLFWS